MTDGGQKLPFRNPTISVSDDGDGPPIIASTDLDESDHSEAGKSYSADSETESSDDDNVTVKCFTFTAPISPPSVEDITANCMNNMLEDVQGEEAVVTGSFLCDASTQVPSNPPLPPFKKPMRQKSLPKRIAHNFSLPSVVIHSDCESSPTLKRHRNSKKESKKLKKKKKDSTLATRSKSFHFSKTSEAKIGSNAKNMIPQLKLPSDDEHSKPNKQALDETDDDEQKLAKKVNGRKRRKSLVNLLFSKQQSQPNPSTEFLTPGDGKTLNGPQGQRLHFRRLSDIICKLSKDKEAGSDKRSSSSKDDLELGTSGGTSGLLSIRQLFPYRRRRSSVSHLDNTEQFRETKEEFMQNSRRRMSSFPPSDGDESTIVLEKIHAQSKLDQEQAAAARAAGETLAPTPSPLRFLRSPLNLLSVSKSKKAASKWKSSTDIPTTAQAQSPSCKMATSNLQNLDGRRGSQSNINNNNNWKDRGSGGNLLMANFPFPYRRSSSPLVAELESLRKEADAAAQGRRGSNDSLPSDRPGVVVFPKRRLEDVPGIFIPHKSSSKSSFFASNSSTNEKLNHSGVQGSVANLLGINRIDRRRHSMSDPVLLEQQFSAVKSFPLLHPRSPYTCQHKGDQIKQQIPNKR